MSFRKKFIAQTIRQRLPEYGLKNYKVRKISWFSETNNKYNII